MDLQVRQKEIQTEHRSKALSVCVTADGHVGLPSQAHLFLTPLLFVLVSLQAVIFMFPPLFLSLSLSVFVLLLRRVSVITSEKENKGMSQADKELALKTP